MTRTEAVDGVSRGGGTSAPPGTLRRVASGPHDNPTGEYHSGSMVRLESLLSTVDGVVRDARAGERFGEIGPAFSTAFGSWLEPFAAAMRGMESTAHSQAAARAMTDLARLTGECASQAMRSVAGLQTGTVGSAPGRLYAGLAGRIDDSFLEFASSPEFDRARRAAAAAILDWLEHDRSAAETIAGALESPPESAPERFGDPAPPETEPVARDGNATLNAFRGGEKARASVLVVPGFTIGARAFDLDPQRSVARGLARHGVETWLLDWGRSDETDRVRTVANQLERIDGAVDAVRESANGRCPALAGHFHGGLLALLYCIRHPGKACALVTLSTPVEFASRGDAFAGWLRACDGERLVDVLGNVPGPLLAALAAASSPMRWCGGGFFALLDGADSGAAAARIARFEQARRFPPSFPGETFRGIYRAFYRDNSFAADAGAVIDGHRYELSRLETPLLNVFASDDRIVPSGASIPLGERTGAVPGSNREYRGGHLDLLTSRNAHDELVPEIAAWLTERTART